MRCIFFYSQVGQRPHLSNTIKSKLPNYLTLGRIFLVPLLVSAMVQQDVTWQVGDLSISNNVIALVIFLVASATDMLDGYLARRWGKVTTIGTLLDPIADKLLVSSALIALVQVRAVPGYIAILIVGREFVVTGLRSIAAMEGYTIQASDLGKMKMIAQVAAISCVLASVRHPALLTLSQWCLWFVVAIAISSAVEYFLQFWRKVDDSVKQRRRRELLAVERRDRILRRKRAKAAPAGAREIS